MAIVDEVWERHGRLDSEIVSCGFFRLERVLLTRIVGGIISTYAFLEKDAPLYRPGYIISVSFLCFSAACCIAYFVAISMENRKRDRLEASGSYAEVGDDAEESMGDMAPSYRYQY